MPCAVLVPVRPAAKAQRSWRRSNPRRRSSREHVDDLGHDPRCCGTARSDRISHLAASSERKRRHEDSMHRMHMLFAYLFAQLPQPWCFRSFQRLSQSPSQKKPRMDVMITDEGPDVRPRSKWPRQPLLNRLEEKRHRCIHAERNHQGWRPSLVGWRPSEARDSSDPQQAPRTGCVGFAVLAVAQFALQLLILFGVHGREEVVVLDASLMGHVDSCLINAPL